MRTPTIDKWYAVNLFLVLCVLVGGPAKAGTMGGDGEVWLITPEEAGMPAAPGSEIMTRGIGPFDISRDLPDTGPLIDVIKPTAGKALPPLEVSVKFAARNAPVDVNSLKVTVVKLVPIDITDRVRPYVTPEGIQIPDARLPSGEHKVRISLADNAGGVTKREMTVTVP